MNRAIFLVTGIFLTAIAFAVPSGLGAGIRDDATQAKLSALSKDPLAASLIATQSSGTPSVVEFTSDSEFNWSELGIDVGIGLFLVGGLILALQFTRHQRVAH